MTLRAKGLVHARHDIHARHTAQRLQAGYRP
jgi:hypothetical protein